MKDLPILMSAPMVRSTRANLKRMTRRALTKHNSKCTSLFTGDGQGWHSLDFNDVVVDGKSGNEWYLKVAVPEDGTRHRVFCKWSVGDTLWVRESGWVDNNFIRGLNEPTLYWKADYDTYENCRVAWGVNGTRSVTSYMYWRKVLSWNRDALADGVRRKVFCASLADVFEEFKGKVIDSHGEQLYWPQYETWEEFENRNDLLEGTTFDDLKGRLWFAQSDCDNIPTFSHCTKKQFDLRFDHKHGDARLDANSQHNKSFYKPLTIETIRIWLFKLIEQTPGLDWLLLTKRPENIMKMVPEHWRGEFPRNVWIGTSVEDQDMADLRIPQLLRVPAEVRFLSCEPLLSELDLKLDVNQTPTIGGPQWTAGELLDWVIVGGESGKNKRPFDCDWARSLRNQCKEAYVDFFMKQVDKIQPIPEDLNIMEFPK